MGGVQNSQSGAKHGDRFRRLSDVQNRPLALDAALRLALVGLVVLLVLVLLPAVVAAQAASAV
jgi:hypothetical protein